MINTAVGTRKGSCGLHQCLWNEVIGRSNSESFPFGFDGTGADALTLTLTYYRGLMEFSTG